MEPIRSLNVSCSSGAGHRLALGAVRIAGHRADSDQGVGIELTVNEQLVVNGRDVDGSDVPQRRSVAIQVVCTRCGQAREVCVFEEDGGVIVSLVTTAP